MNSARGYYAFALMHCSWDMNNARDIGIKKKKRKKRKKPKTQT